MQNDSALRDTRSTADVVFDRLFEEIASLTLLPGSKISEAEVAKRFGVSRQPIRDAFRRLGSLDLLSIRPQRATVVRWFSLDEIANTRFLRLSVELEVIERACLIWDQSCIDALDENLAEQAEALNQGEASTFHDLDYSFHELICKHSNLPMAFETIKACKRKVDRLCVLSLSHDKGRDEVLNDHRKVADALARRSANDARALTRQHFSRLDEVIAEIHQTHHDYFQ